MNTFCFLIQKYCKNPVTFYFYLSNFFIWYFYFYLSKEITKYLYFYLSTHVEYFAQHCKCIVNHVTYSNHLPRCCGC